MLIGLIGLGTVGSTLQDWLQTHTQHTLRLYDPAKGFLDDFTGIEAAFISVPVPADSHGQDLTILREAVAHAKQFTSKVFIRSTVLPGTADHLGCIAMPEFLTERRAKEDMATLPVVSGPVERSLLKEIFPDKKLVICFNNSEAELAKFTHNCFGALKVTYFNIIQKLSKYHGANFSIVKHAANITGFLGGEHMQVPGPDGKFGYGGKCFPENVAALKGHLATMHWETTPWANEAYHFMVSLAVLNKRMRYDND